MRIPLFSTPVFSLKPGQIPPLSETIRTRVSNILSPKQERSFSIGSAPTSPQMQQRRMTTSNLTSQQILSSSLTNFNTHEVDAEYDDPDGPQSLQPLSQPSYFQRFSRSRCSQRTPQDHENDQDQGPLRQICMDCKEMVLQVVRAQSTVRRLQFAKSLFQQQLTSTPTTRIWNYDDISTKPNNISILGCETKWNIWKSLVPSELWNLVKMNVKLECKQNFANFCVTKNSSK